MKSKKIIASLALTSMLFTTVGSFAADRDIWSVSPEQVYATKMEFAKEKAKRLEVAKTPSNYYFEAHGHLFTMKAANEAFAKNPEAFLPDLKVADAVKPINMDLHVVSVSAINSTEAELLFNKEVKEAKQANFKAMDKDGAIVVIAGAKVDAKDKKKVVLTFAEKFKDKMEYTVESEGVVDVDDKAMAKDSDKFTYEAAEVKSVEFTSTTLGKNKDLIDYVKVTDALGRDVTKEVTVEFESSDHNVVNPVTKKTVNGGNAELVAKVKVGADWVKSPKTVVKVSDAVATAFAGYYLPVNAGAAAVDTAAFENLDAEDKVDYIHIGETALLAIYFKDQFGGADVNRILAADLQVEAQTPNIAVIDKTTLVVTAVNEGDAYFKVKHKTAKTENLLKVTVKAVSKPAVMELKEKEIAMSINTPMNKKDVKVVYKNQFGDKIAPTGTLTAKSSDDTVAQVNVVDAENFELTTLKKGMATITLTYKQGAVTLKETIEVTAKEPGDMAGYKAVAADTKLDVNTGMGVTLPHSTTVDVYEVDKDGVYIKEIALGGNKKLVAVDANGVEDSSIVSVAGDTVTAVAEGTGYVKVVLDTITLDEKLAFEVVNTGQTPTKVGLKSSNLEIGDGLTYPIPNVQIVDKVKDMLEFKDQKGKPMAVTVPVTVEFTISKHNENIVFSALDQTVTVTELNDVKSATADIVVKKVTVGTEELTPENELRILLRVNDLVAPVVTGVTEGDVKTTVTPASASADLKPADVKLFKNGAPETYTWGNAINTEGSYKLMVPDKSTNVRTINFTIDTTAPAVVVTADKALAKQGDEVVFTATFTEPVKAGVVPKIELTDGQVLAAKDMVSVSPTIWRYEHTIAAGDGDVKAKISPTATDEAGNAVAGDFVGASKETGLVADNTKPTKTTTTFVSATQIKVTFSEALDAKKFVANNNNGFAVSDAGVLTKAELDSSDAKVVIITGTGFQSGTTKVAYTAGALTDLAQNALDTYAADAAR